MRLTRTGLWRHSDFLRLWAGETVSEFGSQITLLALPLTAVLFLHATAPEMGILTAAQQLPFLVFGLFAGVWIDRRRRRPIMIAADLGRAALLALIPIAAAVGFLQMTLLYPIAFLVGCLTLCFDVSYVAYLPALIGHHRLIDGNSKLQASGSAAQAAGPGLAGLLIGWLSAPFTMAVDAVSYLVSAWCLLRIGTPESPPDLPGKRPTIRRDIRKGLAICLGNPLLRALAGCGMTYNFFGSAFLAVYILFMADTLRLSPFTIGAILSFGGIGALLGAVVTNRVTRWLGIGPTIIWAQLAFALGGSVVPLAVLDRRLALPLLFFAEGSQWAALAVYAVTQLSLRQAIVPPRLHGRVTATFRMLITGGSALGSLAGGFLGGAIGLGPTLAVGAAGMMLAVGWVALSPLRHLASLPVVDEAGLQLARGLGDPVVDSARHVSGSGSAP